MSNWYVWLWSKYFVNVKVGVGKIWDDILIEYLTYQKYEILYPKIIFSKGICRICSILLKIKSEVY